MKVHLAVKDQMPESECRGHFLGGGVTIQLHLHKIILS